METPEDSEVARMETEGAPAPMLEGEPTAEMPEEFAAQAFEERVALLTAELDKTGPAGPQSVRLRATFDNCTRLGVAIRRADGSTETARLTPRWLEDFKINPGDYFIVINLQGDDLRSFVRYAEMAKPADAGDQQ